MPKKGIIRRISRTAKKTVLSPFVGWIGAARTRRRHEKRMHESIAQTIDARQRFDESKKMESLLVQKIERVIQTIKGAAHPTSDITKERLFEILMTIENPEFLNRANPENRQIIEAILKDQNFVKRYREQVAEEQKKSRKALLQAGGKATWFANMSMDAKRGHRRANKSKHRREQSKRKISKIEEGPRGINSGKASKGKTRLYNWLLHAKRKKYKLF
ncbi:MAG: hypothetical protein Q7K42_05540 [Candidatus Diapherotrites archaeon]|nr:hypothetical protein [Candidatus Diapherotrites archaeon]